MTEDRYSELYGNEESKSVLTGFTEREAFPHALILAGPEGSGKRLLASLIATSIACRAEGRRPCSHCEACRKIREGISPDVITVTALKDRRTIGVEAVREIRHTAYIHPNDLSVKIYVFPDAERLTGQAQNALLKLFEEPPRGVYFLLLTSSASSLLPTVRSRAPELRMEVFSDARMTELLTENSQKARTLLRTDATAFQRILHAAVGSYGKALSLIEGRSKKTEGRFDGAQRLLNALSGADKGALLLGLLAESKDREGYASLLRLLQCGVRDMIAARADKASSLTFFADAADACELSSHFTLPSLLNLASVLEGLAIDVTDTNVNLHTAAVVTADRLWELK